MSNDKNHSEQFKKYLKGEMSPQEANAFERKTLNDPFAQEALEGLETQNADQAFSDIADLRNQISHRSKKGFGWIRIAAVVALLFVSAFALWFTIDLTENSTELAIQEKSIEPTPIDSANTTHELEEKEEMIAEAIEDSSIKTFKDDGVRVADTNELIDEDIEDDEITEVEPIMTLAEADVAVDVLTEMDEESPEVALQGKVAGVEVVETAPLAAFQNISLDSSELDAADLMTQPLVAQENIANTRKKSIDIDSNNLRIRGQSSLPRSTNTADITVTGKVTDDTGESLPGVSVIIKGTTTGTQTDLDGSYLLPKLDNMTLVYSFVGFESQEVEVGARSTIDVSMGGASALQEVVVTGYGVSTEESTPSFTPAKPKIGNRKYNKYLKESLQYPTEAINNEVEGTVVLELTISPRGEITDVDIKKSLGYGCDQEAIRLVKEGPKWSAAKNDGNLVEDKVKVRVKFKLGK